MKPKRQAVKAERVSDGFRKATRVSLDCTNATPDDWRKFAEAMDALPPLETLEQETNRRIAEIEARLAALDMTAHRAIPAHVDELRRRLETARAYLGLEYVKPAQIREQFEKADALWQRIERLKFRKGGRGGGPIRKAIAAALKRNPALNNPELWACLKAKPPRGWTFHETPRLGKYAEGQTPTETMGYARFCTVCGEERKALRG